MCVPNLRSVLFFVWLGDRAQTHKTEREYMNIRLLALRGFDTRGNQYVVSFRKIFTNAPAFVLNNEFTINKLKC